MSKYAWAFARHARFLICLGVGCLGVGLAAADAAHAASLSARDVQIIAKALGFLDPAPAGGTVAVLWAHGSAVSQADAKAIVALFGDGVDSGHGRVGAAAIDADALGDGSRYIAVILATDANGGDGLATSRALRLLSISAADALVRSGRCVMVVHSEPRVDITVNRAAARAAGIDFTAAFGMLVHEI